MFEIDSADGAREKTGIGFATGFTSTSGAFVGKDTGKVLETLANGALGDVEVASDCTDRHDFVDGAVGVLEEGGVAFEEDELHGFVEITVGEKREATIEGEGLKTGVFDGIEAFVELGGVVGVGDGTGDFGVNTGEEFGVVDFSGVGEVFYGAGVIWIWGGDGDALFSVS